MSIPVRGVVAQYIAEQDVENLIKKYLKENLIIETTFRNGAFGKYVIVEIKLGDEVVTSNDVSIE